MVTIVKLETGLKSMQPQSGVVPRKADIFVMNGIPQGETFIVGRHSSLIYEPGVICRVLTVTGILLNCRVIEAKYAYF